MKNKIAPSTYQLEVFGYKVYNFDVLRIRAEFVSLIFLASVIVVSSIAYSLKLLDVLVFWMRYVRTDGNFAAASKAR